MENQDNARLYDLICRFNLKNRQYFLLNLINSTELMQGKTLSAVDLFSSSNTKLQEVTRFQLSDRICIIAESQELKSDSIQRLTEREQQIAALVALGQVNKQIAHQLGISDCTVATYLRRIFAKLDVESRAAMVYRCATLIQQLHDGKASLGR